MKISELMGMLDTIQDEHGNLETGIECAEVLNPAEYDDLTAPEVLLLRYRMSIPGFYYAADGRTEEGKGNVRN